jgi:hypothetical protein
MMVFPVRSGLSVVSWDAKEDPMAETTSQPKPSPPRADHGPALTEQERQQWRDHEWVLSDEATQSRHAGLVVAVSNQTVLGVGPTHRDALQAALARPDCPARQAIVTVAVEGCLN